MAVVYACLVVRQYFLAESESELAFAGVMLSRADLCELLAIKLLNRFATHYIQTIAVLTTSWSPLAGAPQQVVETVKMAMNADDDDIDSAHSAVEVGFGSSDFITRFSKHDGSCKTTALSRRTRVLGEVAGSSYLLFCRQFLEFESGIQKAGAHECRLPVMAPYLVANPHPLTHLFLINSITPFVFLSCVRFKASLSRTTPLTISLYISVDGSPN
jgi:hypothetical protein